MSAKHCLASYGVGAINGPNRTGGSGVNAAHNAVPHSNTAAAAPPQYRIGAVLVGMTALDKTGDIGREWGKVSCDKHMTRFQLVPNDNTVGEGESIDRRGWSEQFLVGSVGGHGWCLQGWARRRGCIKLYFTVVLRCLLRLTRGAAFTTPCPNCRRGRISVSVAAP